jgi:hypothetical protein
MDKQIKVLNLLSQMATKNGGFVTIDEVYSVCDSLDLDNADIDFIFEKIIHNGIEVRDFNSKNKHVGKTTVGKIQNLSADFTFIKHIAKLSDTYNGFTKELNIVKWYNNPPIYDIRRWDAKHDKTSGRGVTLTKEELMELQKVLNEIFPK